MRITRDVCIAIVLSVAVVAAATIFAAGAATAANSEVRIDQFAFIPQRITVKAGTTVTWINEDDAPHTIASSDKLFKSKALDTGDKFSFTFTTPGTFSYFCSVHPHMTGAVVVETASGGDAGG